MCVCVCVCVFVCVRSVLNDDSHRFLKNTQRSRRGKRLEDDDVLLFD